MKKKIIGILLSFLIISELLPSFLFNDLLKKAFSEELVTSEIAINYGNLGQAIGSSFFSSRAALEPTVDIPNRNDGMIIKTISYQGANITPQGAIDKTSFNGGIHLAGIVTPVKSAQNRSALGYYAWYRYIPGSSNGLNWYADLIDANGVSHNVNCGPSPGRSGSIHKTTAPPTENISGHNMPVYPDCSSSDFFDLSLTASIDQPYVTDDLRKITISSDNVESITDASADYNLTAVIDGPSNGKGRTNDETINILGKPIQGKDASEYKVNFSQSFDFINDYDPANNREGTTSSKELASPPSGAKVLVYYFAFLVDLTARTYEYSTKVTVTYGPAPDAPNLGNIILDEANACMQSGAAQTLHFSFTNSGAAAVTSTFNVTVFIDGVSLKTFTYNGLSGNGGKGTGTFSYTFYSSKSITISIDKLPQESDQSDNIKIFSINPMTSCSGPTPGPEKITGDFAIAKPQIIYRESNTFTPVDVTVTGGAGCKISSSEWQVTQDAKEDYWYGTRAPWVQTFAGVPYPGNIVIGTVNVTLTITTSCGTTKTFGPKTFELIDDPAHPNQPPVYTSGWFMGGNTDGYPPITEVVVGNYVDLGVVHDPTQTPNTPYDPDGDGIIYHWDFKNSSDPWIQSLYEKFGGWEYDEHYSMIKADVLGTHTVTLTGQDVRGAAGPTRIVTLNVVPPNPVPLIDLPPKVVEGRPFTPDISGSRSYSPGGYAIKQYIWGNKLSIYPSPGPQTVTLDVVDSTGMHAIAPAQATIDVLPDLAPKAQLSYNAIGVRGVTMSFKDTSYSPDDDPIGSHTDTLTCDTNNNGSYADDVSKVLSRDASGGFTYTPTQVGKCRIRVYIDEATPQHKSAQQDYVFDVVNDNPTATFTMAGEVTPPALNLPTVISTDTLLSDAWKSGSLDGDVGKAWYKNSVGNLQPLPIYDTPSYSNMMTASNAPDPNALTVRDATKAEIDAVALGEDITVIPDSTNKRYVIQKNGVTVRTINSSYWSYKYFSTPDYLYFLIGDGTAANGCSSTYYAYLRYPINRLLDLTYSPGTFYTCANSSNQFMDALAPYSHRTVDNYEIYGSPVYPISSSWNYSQGYTEWFVSKVLNGGTVWSLKETGALSSATVLNTDLSKLAYTMTDTNVHLRIRNTVDGSLYKDVVIATGTAQNVMLLNVYQDKIIIRKAPSSLSGSVLAYDFDGNLLWTTTAAKGNYTTDRELVTMSKDGYLLIAYATLSGSTGNFYLQAFDSSNGNLIGESKFFSATTGNSSSLSTAELRGIYLYDNGKVFVKGFDSRNGNWTKILEGPALSRAKKEPINTFGQLYSPTQQAQNAEFAYSMNIKDSGNYYAAKTAGFSFRMLDNLNFYRVEQDIYHIRLVVYINGSRTVLQQTDYGLANDTYYAVKIKANGDRLRVYINGAPVIDVHDSSFLEAGSYGLYSTLGNVEFKGISVTVYPGTQLVDNVIVVGQPIKYTTNYSDPEQDPAVSAKAKWTFTNQQPYVFLDSGDGYSDTPPTNSYSNQVVTTPNPTISKVGIYKVDYQVPDDPSPAGYSYADGVFANYSQYSDPYSQTVKVVRQPVARFTITKNANNTLSPNDQSYDPDRWLSPVKYQSGYQTNRGIFDRKWKYTAPDGTPAFGFPTNPNQTGIYTVSEVVMQEDGIWSEWYDQTVEVTVAIPNNPPLAVLTYPTGTQSAPSFSSTTQPAIMSPLTSIDGNRAAIFLYTMTVPHGYNWR